MKLRTRCGITINFRSMPLALLLRSTAGLDKADMQLIFAVAGVPEGGCGGRWEGERE